MLDFRRASVRRTALAHHGADCRQHRDRPAGGLRQPALDGIADLLRTGVPRADASAIHGVATGDPRARRLRRRATSEKAPPGSCKRSFPVCGNCVHVATNSYPSPIPPGTEMSPGAQAQTCVGCHEPRRASGDRIRVIREYADDETNSETLTVLQMHLNVSTSSTRAIHWHADPDVRVEYVATDHERQTIPYVKVTDAKGSVKEYRATDATDQMISAGSRRDDGLCRLPQYRRAPDFADAGKGRRSSHRRGASEPRSSIRAA